MTEQELEGRVEGLHAGGKHRWQGYLDQGFNAFPENPTVRLHLGVHGGPGGGAFSYERGTPCIDHIARPRKHRRGAIGAIEALLNRVQGLLEIKDTHRP